MHKRTKKTNKQKHTETSSMYAVGGRLYSLTP